MGFCRWVTTRKPLSLEAFGQALSEIAPELQILHDPASDQPDRSISSIGAMTFGFALGDSVVGVPLELSADREGSRVRIWAKVSGFAGEAITLGLLAAAVHAAGGRYGDDGDNEWSAKEVAAAYAKEARSLRKTWSRMPPAEQTRILEVERAER